MQVHFSGDFERCFDFPEAFVLVDVSDIFYSFIGRGKGESEASGGRRGSIVIEILREGGSPGGGGAEGPGKRLRRIGWGGGGEFFFFVRGRNVHQSRFYMDFQYGPSSAWHEITDFYRHFLPKGSFEAKESFEAFLQE